MDHICNECFTYSLNAGEITIIKLPNGNYWLCKDDGEGMEVKKERFEELLQNYFKENF